MAVVFDAQGSAAGAAGAATSINFANLTVGSGSNRALVVVASFSNQAITGLTVTWDNGGTNQSCGLIGAANSSDTFGREVIYGLVAPTSGNKTLRLAWTGSSDVYVDAVAYTGANQTGGATSFAHFTSATGNSATPSVTVTSASGNAVVACGSANIATPTATNNTNIYLGTSLSSVQGWANRAAGAATVTMTATINSDLWGQAGCDIVAALTATTVFSDAGGVLDSGMVIRGDNQDAFDSSTNVRSGNEQRITDWI